MERASRLGSKPSCLALLQYQIDAGHAVLCVEGNERKTEEWAV